MSYQQNNQGGGRPQGTPRKKSFLNDWRQPHPATDAPLEGGKYPAQFMWEVTNAGKIVLKISDGVFKEGAKSPHKEVEMNGYDRNILFEALIEATNMAVDFPARQFFVKKHDFVRVGGQSRLSEQPITKVMFSVSRDEQGVINLVYTKGDYKVKTRFKGPNSSVIMVRNAAGEIVEDHGFMSRMYTRSWVKFHQEVLDRMERDGWEPPKPKGDFNGGGQGGGGGGYRQGTQGGNGGNPNQSNSNFDDFEDDIPF